jgi:hypothetical protein
MRRPGQPASATCKGGSIATGALAKLRTSISIAIQTEAPARVGRPSCTGRVLPCTLRVRDGLERGTSARVRLAELGAVDLAAASHVNQAYGTMFAAPLMSRKSLDPAIPDRQADSL